MEYNFRKVHTGKDLAISILVLLAGVGLYFLNPGLGICIGTCGLLMSLFYKAVQNLHNRIPGRENPGASDKTGD